MRRYCHFCNKNSASGVCSLDRCGGCCICPNHSHGGCVEIQQQINRRLFAREMERLSKKRKREQQELEDAKRFKAFADDMKQRLNQDLIKNVVSFCFQEVEFVCESCFQDRGTTLTIRNPRLRKCENEKECDGKICDQCFSSYCAFHKNCAIHPNFCTGVDMYTCSTCHRYLCCCESCDESESSSGEWFAQTPSANIPDSPKILARNTCAKITKNENLFRLC